MPEPITEVWRVSGGAKATEGIYESEEIARAQHSLNRSAGFRKASLERLPLATPEMVEFINAARGFVQAQRESGFGTNAMMPHWHRLEAAERAAGGVHGP